MTSRVPRLPPPCFYDAGEAALVVEFGDAVDPAINRRVVALDDELSKLRLAGIRELVPTYRSLMVLYDPMQLPRQSLCDRIGEIVSDENKGSSTGGNKSWLIPCCYDRIFAEDIDEVANATGLSPTDIASAHAGARYRLYMYGFAPAYCYLGGLSHELHIQRRQRPRPPHPAGAILIGGGLASIATFPMPTGWYVLGRTPAKLFEPKNADPFFLRPGDCVRFLPITPDEFVELEARVDAGESLALEIGLPEVAA